MQLRDIARRLRTRPIETSRCLAPLSLMTRGRVGLVIRLWRWSKYPYRMLKIEKVDSMLDAQIFKTVKENAPLVSIDFSLLCDGQIFLGKRTSEPLKGMWFRPRGRIHKNETWRHALLRIVKSELGLWYRGSVSLFKGHLESLS